MKKLKNPRFTGTEWKNKDILDSWEIVSKLATDKYNLSFYEPQFEIVTEDLMIDACCSHALPNLYNHWSFGKSYEHIRKDYLSSEGGTILEMVINSNPSICYLLYSNDLMGMIDVIAHASVGHASFFKNNYLFKDWTDADTILAFCNSAKEYIKECEDKYGISTIEFFIDVLNSVSNLSYDKKRIKVEKTLSQLKREKIKKEEDDQKSVNYLFESILNMNMAHNDAYTDPESTDKYDSSDNILRMFKKHGNLPTWQNKIIDIFMYINQYFYPQFQTKLMNEGWATFWDYELAKDLHDLNIIDNNMYMDRITLNGSVCYQSVFSYISKFGKRRYPATNPRYSGINPYHLGSEMFKEIKRVCLEQDEESLFAVPSLKKANWIESVTFAMENFRDESFVSQYLTPNLVRKLKLAYIETPQEISNLSPCKRTVIAAHDDIDFDTIRSKLSQQYSLESKIPSIKSVVHLGNEHSKRIVPELHLIYKPYKDLDLDPPYKKDTLKYIEYLWKGKVLLHKECIHENDGA